MAARTPSALSVYLIAAGFRPPLPSPDSFARNYSDRIWIHVCDTDAAGAVPTLASRLAEARGGDSDLTLSGLRSDGFDPEVRATTLPRERASDIRRRLEEDPPAVALFFGFEVAPAFLYGLRECGTRTVLLASPTGVDLRARDRLVAHKLYRLFDRILATNEEARTALIKAGAPPERIEVVGRLDDNVPAPSADPEQQDELSRTLAGRPLWMAVELPLTETRAVLDAQRQANGMSHRLLLVIVPQHPTEAEALATAVELRGYNVARRSLGQIPEEHIQVLIADVPEEIGLWYRLSPIVYMGGSFVPPGSNARPDHPAALGSAILYGPEIGENLSAFDGLASVGGARRIDNSRGLGTTVSSLLSPDKPAAMAHAAWLEISKGAEGTERVVDVLMQALDAPEEFEAPTRTGAD